MAVFVVKCLYPNESSVGESSILPRVASLSLGETPKVDCICTEIISTYKSHSLLDKVHALKIDDTRA